MHVLDDVDDLLRDLRRAQTRPSHRRRLLDGTTIATITTLRLVRAVDQLDGAGGPPSVRGLADHLGAERSVVSRQVEAAVSAGLLTKTPADDDRRRCELGLTPRGADAVERATRNRRDVLAEILGSWPTADVEALGALLARLRDAYDSLDGRDG